MSMATFWMSLTNLENLSEETLIEMEEKVGVMMYERNALLAKLGTHRNDTFGTGNDTEMQKLSQASMRIEAEFKRRGL